MATPNPMKKTYPTPPRPVSRKTHCIAGILTTVYGLSELPAEIHEVACLWLLHPRLQNQSCMEPIASSTINEWNDRLQKRTNRTPAFGLIAVSFDQRNHGTREVDPLANEAWKSGNERHAQDMFSVYHGTATDTSLLLTYLPSYIFPTSSHTLTRNFVLGVSLGGHAAWHCLMHHPRITTGIIIIGCPDYIQLMTDRARLSKLETWTRSDPPGSTFLGSQDFPWALVEAVEKSDPAAMLTGGFKGRDRFYRDGEMDDEETRVASLLKNSLQGKRILNLAGGDDKLVPYRCSEPFLIWLKKAIGQDGCFDQGGVVLEDIVFDGVGHEMSPDMVKEVHRFIVESLELTPPKATGRNSKI